MIIDTSVVIAVITNEPHKRTIIELTQGVDLFAPTSLHWEIGNAFSAMLKKKNINIAQIKEAIDNYYSIPIHFVENIDLKAVIEWCNELNIYAYDAYFIECAKRLNMPLMTLDKKLQSAAKKVNIKIVEVL